MSAPHLDASSKHLPGTNATAPALRVRQLCVALYFLMPGLLVASWVTRTPAVRDAINASTAQMGLVLLGLSLGSMAGIAISGWLVATFGARLVILAGNVGMALGALVIGLGTSSGSQLLVAVGLALFGLGMGGSEVAINVEGAEVEVATGKLFLPILHGAFSLGTLVGAGIGILAVTVNLPVLWHLVIIGAADLIVAWAARPGLMPAAGRTRAPRVRAGQEADVDGADLREAGVDRASVEEASVQEAAGSGEGAAASAAKSVQAKASRPEPASKPRPVWRDPVLLLIGVVVLAMAMAEGTANDWLPLIMVDGHGMPAWVGSSMFAIFAAAMTLGRFLGTPLVARMDRGAVLAVSAALGAVGLLAVALIDNASAAMVAVVLWGIGTSLGFPVAISAAAASGPNETARVSVAAMIGYFAMLVGPPVLGFAGEHVGLRYALLVPMAVMVAGVFASRAARAGKPGAGGRGRGPGRGKRERSREVVA